MQYFFRVIFSFCFSFNYYLSKNFILFLCDKYFFQTFFTFESSDTIIVLFTTYGEECSVLVCDNDILKDFEYLNVISTYCILLLSDVICSYHQQICHEDDASDGCSQPLVTVGQARTKLSRSFCDKTCLNGFCRKQIETNITSKKCSVLEQISH